MSNKIYPVDPEVAAQAHLDAAGYAALYRRSIEAPEAFWAEQAARFLTWSRPWDTVRSGDFDAGRIRWFEGGTLNASVNCLDRHLEDRAEQLAIIWEEMTRRTAGSLPITSCTRRYAGWPPACAHWA